MRSGKGLAEVVKKQTLAVNTLNKKHHNKPVSSTNTKEAYSVVSDKTATSRRTRQETTFLFCGESGEAVHAAPNSRVARVSVAIEKFVHSTRWTK